MLGLGSLLNSIWDLVFKGFELILKQFKEGLAGFWAFVVLALYYLKEFLDLPIRLINWVLGRFENVEVPTFNLSGAGIASDILGIANVFFPLDEFVRYFTLYSIWYALWAVYAKLKSWIPSIFGWTIPGGR